MSPHEHLEHIRHSLAHLLAAAVQELWPDTKRAIGPTIENGFYYDFEFQSPISDKDLPKIEARMKKILATWSGFKRHEVTKEEALKEFSNNPYKKELIEEFSTEGKALSVYESGSFRDLCAGGHVEDIKDIDPDAFSLSHVAGAYWRGNEQNKMLTRIYGLAFRTKEELAEYKEQQEKARERDHKKLGRELDLFYIDEQVGKGLPLWTPKGTTIKYELENFTRSLEKKYGYKHVSTPYLAHERLYKTSGHLDHYRDSMYPPIEVEGDRFYLRPMACPHHIRLLQRNPISYRDLPVRYAEIADYNRYEKSGELMGMIRVRKFQLTDAHIFTSKDGLKEEFKGVCALIREGMQRLGLQETVTYQFSKRDPNNKEKYFPDDVLWNKAESTMKEALDEIGFNYIEALDEAAFYGPKLDVQAKNVNGKEDTLYTAQIDFLLPEKFDITFTNAAGDDERVVMIHRSAIGSLERIFAFLIEHYAGAFPLWLAPVQVKILPVGEAHRTYAKEVHEQLVDAGIRAELDLSNETLGKRIRSAKLEKVPYFLVLGDKEINDKKVTLESRDEDKTHVFEIQTLIDHLTKELHT